METSTLAQLYDAYITQYEEDLPFWVSMVEKYGGPVLELGCGTGRVLLALANAGYEVEGVDHDPAMLDVARKKLFPKSDASVELHLGDLREFSIATRFPLIIIPCNTFSYFNDEDCGQILRCSKSHLLQGGHLIIDLPNTDREGPPTPPDTSAEGSEIISAFISPQTNLPVHVSVRRMVADIGISIGFIWSFDELYPDGTVGRFNHPIRYHMRSVQSMKKLLTGQGFTNIECYGNYDRTSHSPDSERMIFKCQLC